MCGRVAECEDVGAHSSPGAVRRSVAGQPFKVHALGLGDDVRIEEELGRGAQTAVYRLRRGGVDYALKVRHGIGPDTDATLTGFCRVGRGAEY